MANNQPVHRRPAGVGGGQFAPGPNRGRADLSLENTGSDGLSDADDLPETDEILGADSERLWDYVRHTDPLVRAEAAGSLHLTAAQLDELQDPTRQPPSVREAAARLPYPGVAARAAQDPSAVVRWLAAQGWDLSDKERSALAADPEVRRVSDVMSDRLQPSS